MPIYKNGNEYSQIANGGVNISETIRRLVGKPSSKARLPAAVPREGIQESVATSFPSAGSQPNSGGIASPLVEQEYAGSTYYQVVSSDGFIVFEYPDQTEYVDDDGAGSSIIVKHYDMTPA